MAAAGLDALAAAELDGCWPLFFTAGADDIVKRMKANKQQINEATSIVVWAELDYEYVDSRS